MHGLAPILIHSFTFGDEFGFVKQIEYDFIRKHLICLTQSSSIVTITIDLRDEKNSHVTVRQSNPYDNESLLNFNGSPALNCFSRGTDKGKVRFCEIDKT